MPTTLVVTNDFPPRIGGIESFVADLAPFLDDDVVVLTSTGPPRRRSTPGGPTGGAPARRPLLPSPAGRPAAAESLLRRSGADRVLFGAAAPLGLLAAALRRAGAGTGRRPDPRPRDLVGDVPGLPDGCSAGSATRSTC